MKKLFIIIISQLVIFGNLFATEPDAVNLEAPILVSPANTATNQSTSITLDWNDVASATSYEYWYSTDQYFSTFISGFTPNSEIALTGLNNNTTYYWKVIASDGTDWSAWSEAWHFTTEESGVALVTPILISPTNNAIDQELSLTLLWNIVGSATSYEYQYSTDNTFGTYYSETTQSSQISISGLEYNTQYFWRIQATDGTNYSDWSEIWSFTTKTSDLGTPILVSPANNATNQPVNLTLDWNEVTDASSYEYQYSTYANFATYTAGTTSDTEIDISNLNNNTMYFWRIKATDGSIFSEWSEIWSFTTEINISVDNIYANEIRIYPNPASSFITIDYDSKSLLSFQIYDMQAKLVISQQNNSRKINVSKLKSGTYFIKIKENNDVLKTSIFIKK